MAKTLWRQTFKRDGVLLKNAGVSIYLAGTSTSARIFDANDNLHDTAPQFYTDSAGFADLYIDPDDYSTGQLFDVLCQPDARCNTENEVRLPSLQILQDTEGHRNFKNIFTQTTMPTTGMKIDDLWFDTDNDNHPYTYDGTNWISTRDGTIATAANTANWSQVVDDNTHKPDNDADVTSTHNCLNPGDYTASNTANNTKYVHESDTEAGHIYDVAGDLRMRSGADISFYDSSNNYRGGIYSNGANILLSSNSSLTFQAQSAIYIKGDLLPDNNTYQLGSSSYSWNKAYFANDAKVYFNKSPSGTANILTMNSSNYCYVGGECAACILGNNCTVNDPVYIRVNGSNAQQVTRSSDTDGAGKHYLVVA